jgi:hypothetical protein
MLAPVGTRQWTMEDQGLYALGFVIGGSPTWAAIYLGYLTWLVWDGRTGRSMSRSDRKVLPLRLAWIAAFLGLAPWGWPAAMLPGGLWWDIPLVLVLLVLFLLMMAVDISDQPPPVLIPRDLRPVPPPPEALPFWLDVVVLIVTLVPVCAFAAWLLVTQHVPKIVVQLAGGALAVLAALVLYRLADWVRERRQPPASHYAAVTSASAQNAGLDAKSDAAVSDAAVSDGIGVSIENGTDHRWTVDVLPDLDNIGVPEWSDGDLDSLLELVEHTIQKRYADRLPPDGLRVDYDLHPWGWMDGDDVAPGRTMPDGLGTVPLFWLTPGSNGYSVSILGGDPRFEAASVRLSGVPQAIIMERVRLWPELAGVAPFGEIQWARTLLADGFVEAGPAPEPDPADLKAEIEEAGIAVAAAREEARKHRPESMVQEPDDDHPADARARPRDFLQRLRSVFMRSSNRSGDS